jgi:hypothetical protein
LTGDSTGGLLGSLLCPLLDPLGPLDAIVDALNQILAVLQGL